MKYYAIHFKRNITQKVTIVAKGKNDLEATKKAEARLFNDKDVYWNMATSEIGDTEIHDITILAK